ncbi:SMI1/KNR4 family protein [Agreia pratensis]|uniref:SMI1-KNR4 cell-wall n=1 Tax=Agreia pratensis TaxID=150121 RepID=A0A1X7IYW6_9MICO|nr:SMI1/KNR4 family protein [Agreia pratensis]SMG20353.1 SMI1-KNR4 cell-wall [Agreia pratensis]
MTYSDLAALLRGLPDAEFGSGASEDDISQAEGLIGPLVGEYRSFLEEFGWANIRHLEIFGLGDGTTTANDLVKTTLFERSYGRIPHLVPVENIGTGDLCCVRQVPGTLYDSPVILSPLDSGEADYIEDREGFAHWLIERVKNII